MCDDIGPVQVAVFSVDDNPIQPERDGDFSDAGRFESDPQAVDRALGTEFGAEGGDSGNIHECRRSASVFSGRD